MGIKIFRRVLQFPGGFSFDLNSTRWMTEIKQRDQNTSKTVMEHVLENELFMKAS